MSMHEDSLESRARVNGAPAIQTTWPFSTSPTAENPEEESGVKGQPTSCAPMFRPPVILYQYRSSGRKFPVKPHGYMGPQMVS